MAPIDSNEKSTVAYCPAHSAAGVSLLNKSGFNLKKLTISLLSSLLFSVAVAAQSLPTNMSPAAPQVAPPVGVRLKGPITPSYEVKPVIFAQAVDNQAVGLRASSSQPAATSARVRRITLQEAQEMAAGASNPLVRLGELQVEAATQHRKGVQGLYFPNIGAQTFNLHFNKLPGDVFTAQGPLGNQRSVAVNVINKNETTFNLAAIQPITPLFAIYQLVKIARADENIARAKAGMPVAEIASKLEQNYFDLLVAQRELITAEAESKKVQGKWLTASSSGVTSVSTEQETDMIGAAKAVVLPASRVKELTASLNDLIGLPEGTRLELASPEPLIENVSLKEATDKAMVANTEVVEAEQTAVKARAANKLSKMEYFPTVALVGGYANQTAMNVVLPRDFSYIGLMANLTVFDGFKREHGVKESKANADAADLGVQLTKAKVAAAVKTSYFELERSRQFTQLARRMASATNVVEASYQPDHPEVESARAKVEEDMFRAELEYRQALARLKSLMGEQ